MRSFYKSEKRGAYWVLAEFKKPNEKEWRYALVVKAIEKAD
jgi:hypothetical protein